MTKVSDLIPSIETLGHDPASPGFRASFKSLFESLPGMFLIMDRNLIMVAASDAHLAGTHTTREQILGRYVFDIFTDDPDDPVADGVENLKASFLRVINERRLDTMAAQKFSILTARGFEAKWWSPVNSPILDDRGEVAYVVNRVEDITEYVRSLKGQGERALTEAERKVVRLQADVVQRAHEILNARDELEAERIQLKQVFEQAPAPIAFYQGPEHRFAFANSMYRECFIGDRAYVDRPLREVLPTLADQGFMNLMDQVFLTGERYVGKEAEFSFTAPDGQARSLVFNFVYEAMRDAEGRVQGILIAISDLTEQVHARDDLVDTLESMSDAFVSVDRNWVITRVNAKHERLSGLPRAEQVGHSFLDVCFRSEACRSGEFWFECHRAMRERTFGKVEDHSHLFDAWIEMRIYPKSDGGLALFLTDVTARRTLEVAQQFDRHKFETIFAESPAAMALWQGHALRFEMVNAEYRRVFGDRVYEGLTLTEVYPELKNTEYPEIIRGVFETGQAYHAREKHARLATSPGGPLVDRYFDTSFMRVERPDGSPYGVYNHVTEVSTQVASRRELEIAKGEAERANQTKSAFLANMSHEIRTPLGAILGFTELLKEHGLSTDERAQYLDTISRNGRALTRIIDDILDLAKVESGKLDVEQIEFDFADLLAEVRDLFFERARAKGITIEIEWDAAVPRRIFSDPTRLRQIFINIIGNAVKFTHRGGVTVAVEVAHVGGDGLHRFRVRVADTGVGVSPEQRDRLFQPFTQADNTTTRKYGGTGLGLALSSRLAKALGGEITLDDCPPGRGCVFVIGFVARATQTDATSVDALADDECDPDLRLSGVRVLVAEDSPDNRFLIERMLVKNGARVGLAANGLEAYRMVLNEAFDIVLMDIQMPEMDGYEATRALREAGWKKPIIALTAHAMADERARSRAAGCTGHITKPLNQPDLIKAIEGAMH